jgi:hypothetical protein
MAASLQYLDKNLYKRVNFSPSDGYGPGMTHLSSTVTEGSGASVPDYLSDFQSTNDWVSESRPTEVGLDATAVSDGDAPFVPDVPGYGAGATSPSVDVSQEGAAAAHA